MAVAVTTTHSYSVYITHNKNKAQWNGGTEMEETKLYYF